MFFARSITGSKNNSDSNDAVSPTRLQRVTWWLRKLGPLAFLGFFVKGMLWLIIPAMMAKGIIGSSNAPQAPEAHSSENIVKANQ